MYLAGITKALALNFFYRILSIHAFMTLAYLSHTKPLAELDTLLNKITTLNCMELLLASIF